MKLNNLYTGLTRIKICFIVLATILLATSCLEDTIVEQSSGDDVKFSLNLAGSQLRSGGDEDETDIFDLRLIILEKEGSEVKSVINRLVKSTSSLTGQTINIKLSKKTYTFYFIANAEYGRENPSVLTDISSSGIDSESDVEAILIQYTNENTPQHPFVMFEKWADVPISGDVTEDVFLKYTCTKVKYKIVFDNTTFIAGDPLKDKRFELKSIQFKNLAVKSNLSTPTLISGQTYFNAAKTQTFGSTDFDQNSWIYSDSIYIPECLYPTPSGSEEITYSHMEIVGNVIGSSVNSTYKINITGEENNTSKKITPRATVYNLTGTIKSLGERDGIDVQLDVASWTPKDIFYSAGEYTLWVSKTKFKIDSTTNDTLYYKSNAPALSFDIDDDNCAFELPASNTNSEGMVILKAGSQSITGNLSSIAKLSVSLLKSSESGASKVLTKVVDVTYDFEPFLRVIPELVQVNWVTETQSAKDAGKTMKTVSYITNLSTVEIVNDNSPVGYSVNISGTNTNKIEIEVPYLDKNSSTVKYTFDVKAHDGTNTVVRQRTVTVIVSPDLSGYYRIHFRVINDDIGGSATAMKRWANCYLDMYNETSTNVSRFLGTWPGTQMYYDSAKDNGWFYFDVEMDKVPNATGVNANNESKPIDNSARIEPGVTMIMFTYDNGSGSSRFMVKQRYPAHKDPGVPLFNFDDNEGWFVYDPTAGTGTLSFYDEEPDILNQAYTFYTNASWSYCNLYLFRQYGSTNDNPSGPSNSGAHKIEPLGGWSGASCSSVSGWWKITFNINAVFDNLGKELYYVVNGSGGQYPLSGTDLLLFEGKSVTEGWFDYSTKKWSY